MTKIELHRNGVTVISRYTDVRDVNGPPIINYVEELSALKELLETAGRFYDEVSYSGPLVASFSIRCPESYALHLPRRRNRVTLEPSGTSITIRIEPAASELISTPQRVLKSIGGELFRAFGIWRADCFDDNDQLFTPHGYQSS